MAVSGDFATTTSALTPCPYCSGYHTTTCPKIKAIEYHQNGAVKRIEFHSVAAAREGQESLEQDSS